jgi:hypothetical protein
VKLKEAQIRLFCQKILHTLRTQQLVAFKKSEGECLAKMESIVVGEAKIHETLERDADKLLEQYAAQGGSALDRKKMFDMIKKQLAKERRIIL